MSYNENLSRRLETKKKKKNIYIPELNELKIDMFGNVVERDYDMGMLRRFQFFYPNTVWINHSSVEISEIRDNAIYEGQDIHFPVLILRARL